MSRSTADHLSSPRLAAKASSSTQNAASINVPALKSAARSAKFQPIGKRFRPECRRCSFRCFSFISTGALASSAPNIAKTGGGFPKPNGAIDRSSPTTGPLVSSFKSTTASMLSCG